MKPALVCVFAQGCLLENLVDLSPLRDGRFRGCARNRRRTRWRSGCRLQSGIGRHLSVGSEPGAHRPNHDYYPKTSHLELAQCNRISGCEKEWFMVMISQLTGRSLAW